MDFISGPIMPGDTLKVEGKQEIYPASAYSGTPETVVQRVAMDVAAYWYYPKESVATGPFTNHFVTEYPSDGYKAGIVNAQLNEALKGLEFVTTKIYNRQGNYVEVISGFVNHTGKILRVAENGEGPACNNMEALNEFDGEGNCIRTYNLRAKGMIVRIYEPECDLTYDLDGGSLQGKTNPSTYTVATLEPYSVKIWGPVKEGFHCTSMGTSDGRSSLFGNDFTKGIEDGQRYFIHEYWPGYFGYAGGTGQNRDFWFSFNKGYTAVFHGNGGTINGQDTWISEVDRDKDSTYPYKYTDVNFTPDISLKAGTWTRISARSSTASRMTGLMIQVGIMTGVSHSRTVGHSILQICMPSGLVVLSQSQAQHRCRQKYRRQAQHRCHQKHRRLVQHQRLPRHRSKV